MAASRTLLRRTNFLSCVAVSELNSPLLSQLFGAPLKKCASYVTYSKNSACLSGTSVINVRTSSVLNKYGVRNFSLQNWLGVKASELTVDNIKDFDEDVGCPICRRNLTFNYKDVLFLSQFMSPKGYVLNRRVTGVCRRQQRKLEKAIRISQRLGILPKLSPILRRELEAQKQKQKQS